MKKVSNSIIKELLEFNRRADQTLIKSIAQVELELLEREQPKVVFSNLASYSLN